MTHEASLILPDSPQTWSLGRFWHAEVESAFENHEILHPDPEMKEKRPDKLLTWSDPHPPKIQRLRKRSKPFVLYHFGLKMYLK